MRNTESNSVYVVALGTQPFGGWPTDITPINVVEKWSRYVFSVDGQLAQDAAQLRDLSLPASDDERRALIVRLRRRTYVARGRSRRMTWSPSTAARGPDWVSSSIIPLRSSTLRSQAIT